jgi:hypothetical protein
MIPPSAFLGCANAYLSNLSVLMVYAVTVSNLTDENI